MTQLIHSFAEWKRFTIGCSAPKTPRRFPVVGLKTDHDVDSEICSYVHVPKHTDPQSFLAAIAEQQRQAAWNEFNELRRT